MDRRSFLKAPVSVISEPDGDPPVRNKYANKKIPKRYKSVSSAGLDPYTGPWEIDEAKHLLNRTMFGCTKAQLDAALLQGMNATVAQLLTPAAAPNPPLNGYYNEAADPNCAAGDTWIDKTYNSAIDFMRAQSLKDWWLDLMINQDICITEKMTLFLSNMLPIQFYGIPDSRMSYDYLKLLRANSLGNYKSLLLAVTKHPAMLVYLNGYKNQRNKPDENYARELQELFTVGKGPDSKYTEDDVKQAARVLTGYSIDLTTLQYQFIPTRHDTGTKQFSSFYGNAVINGISGANGENETSQLLDVIFSQPEAAKHIIRALYRWFVYYVIDEEVEENIITPLADQFRNGGYELMPVLETLLKSEHFYDDYNRGCVIKPPMDYIAGMVKNFNIILPDSSDVAKHYYGKRALNIFAKVLAQDIGDPPNVAGWEAFRLNPVYHEAWINSVTVSYRNQLFELLLSPNGYNYKSIKIKVDYLTYTQTVANAEDPNELINNLVDKFLCYTISETQKAGLKSILLSGQASDHYWTDAWLNYMGDPGNAMYRSIVDLRLYSFYRYFLSLAESQLI